VRRVAARDNLTTSRVANELKRAHKFSENFIETEFALAPARHKDEGAADRSEYRQAAGAIAQDLTTTPLLRLPWAEIGDPNEEG
jgi:hypothetical protein